MSLHATTPKPVEAHPPAPDDALAALESRVRSKSASICVVGLGYVGLPLAV